MEYKDMLEKRAKFMYTALNNVLLNNVNYTLYNKEISEDDIKEQESIVVMLNDCFLKACMVEIIYKLHHNFTENEAEFIDKLCVHADLFRLIPVVKCVELSSDNILKETIIKEMDKNFSHEVIEYYKECVVLEEYKEIVSNLITSIIVLLGVVREDYDMKETDIQIIFTIINNYCN